MKKLFLLWAACLFSVGVSAQYTLRLTSSVVRGQQVTQHAATYLFGQNAIAAGATAHYTAGQAVVLENGFSAEPGAVFEARIAPGREAGAALYVTAYPNPFSQKLTIEYHLPEDATVQLGLYDASGRLVEELLPAGRVSAGKHSLEYSPTPEVAAGLYLYRLRANEKVILQKAIKQ